MLVGLTDQAAFAFVSRHMYGLKGPGSSQQLKWQLMSLKALRYVAIASQSKCTCRMITSGVVASTC